MIGFLGMAGGIRRAGLAMALAAGMSALPDLGQQRTLSSRPGAGLVKRSGGRSPRRDGARQAAAQAKRERKNAKRYRDAFRCYGRNRCQGGNLFAQAGVIHGQ